MEKYQLLEHPADLKIKIWGGDLSELFTNAAKAMAEQLAITDNGKAGKEEIIELKSDSLNFLLIDWLSELLSLGDANKMIYSEIKIEKLSEQELRAKVSGQPIKEKKNDIKAVTYHQAEVKKTDDGWQAIVVFDI